MTTRVLIVEDNPVNRELIDYLLKAHGFEVLTALDGAVGLDVARRERPELILCDILMPVMEGIEFAQHARADPALRDTPLVALTALAMPGDSDRILAAGFDGYIAKPVDPTTFIATIDGYLPPALRSAAAAARSASAAPGAVARGVPRAVVLLLDDTPANLELERDLLEPNGYEVLAASGADEAWALAQARTPDLIISDIGMPVGSGFGFIRRVKADARLRDVPFIFITSTHWDAATEVLAGSLGATRYLKRPLEPLRLLAEIRECLAPRR